MVANLVETFSAANCSSWLVLFLIYSFRNSIETEWMMNADESH